MSRKQNIRLCVSAIILSVYFVLANARLHFGKYGLIRYPVSTPNQYVQSTYVQPKFLRPAVIQPQYAQYVGAQSPYYQSVFPSQKGDSIVPQTMMSRDMESMSSAMMTSQEMIEFQMSMLDLHNKLRANVGLTPLQWSPELSGFALNHMITTEATTGTCAAGHSTVVARQAVGPFTNVGENLFVSIQDMPTAENVMSAWYNEGLCYRYSSFGDECTMTIPVSPQQQCDPKATIAKYFTQLMWSTTTHVGCAIHKCSSCTTVGCPQYVVGCNYGSSSLPYGGNVVGTPPFDRVVANKLNVPVCINNDVQDLQFSGRRFLDYATAVKSPMVQTTVDPVTGFPSVRCMFVPPVDQLRRVPSIQYKTIFDPITGVPVMTKIVDPMTEFPMVASRMMEQASVDPMTGFPMVPRMMERTVIDPVTGVPMAVPSMMGRTVVQPVTGFPIVTPRTMGQTVVDPFAGVPSIISQTVVNPVTGVPMVTPRMMEQTVVDPVTGVPMVPTRMMEQAVVVPVSGVPMVTPRMMEQTVIDPVTGVPMVAPRMMEQTVIDPVTGVPMVTRVPIITPRMMEQTVVDPLTGVSVTPRMMEQTVIDPVTGVPMMTKVPIVVDPVTGLPMMNHRLMEQTVVHPLTQVVPGLMEQTVDPVLGVPMVEPSVVRMMGKIVNTVPMMHQGIINSATAVPMMEDSLTGLQFRDSMLQADPMTGIVYPQSTGYQNQGLSPVYNYSRKTFFPSGVISNMMNKNKLRMFGMAGKYPSMTFPRTVVPQNVVAPSTEMAMNTMQPIYV